ncbi:Predicted PurR-regulated permease PerM [Nocardioides terrae]|uniref:Predicted PurR-regulated permease PerM n=1 Tax=Nocardioides terrae TaxID=574651 RepID=A0A1I1E4H6_9ACTN|nr:AI-2E family transporter [Nocardioides terrae]SFB79840.1 Predicted PurR-regulated permease PerM [Nocardioides terrae]
MTEDNLEPPPLAAPPPAAPPSADDAGFAARLLHQWSQLREERQAQLAVPVTTRVPVGRPEVPRGVEMAAQWSWRFLVIAGAGYLLVRALGFLEVVVIPIVVAMLIAALVVPVVAALQRVGLPRGVSSLLVVIGGILFIASLLTFAGQQVANGAHDLADQTVKGLDEIKDWLKTGPLNASDSQINDYIDRIQKSITDQSQGSNVVGRVGEVGTALSHVFAGLFITLFATYFFLADGDRIWSWIVRLAPRAARDQVDGSGRVAWISLTQFVRATVIVAAVDAIGVMIVAAILGVPFVAAIGVLVFLGAFVPLVGATVAGSVAVLVALVDQGLITALLMLAGVILVQQLEAHGLQPFLLGRWVSVHPLGVIVAIATGILVAGIAGALVAVPLAAAINAVVQHLVSGVSAGALADEAPVGDDVSPDVSDDATDAPGTADLPDSNDTEDSDR